MDNPGTPLPGALRLEPQSKASGQKDPTEIWSVERIANPSYRYSIFVCLPEFECNRGGGLRLGRGVSGYRGTGPDTRQPHLGRLHTLAVYTHTADYSEFAGLVPASFGPLFPAYRNDFPQQAN